MDDARLKNDLDVIALFSKAANAGFLSESLERITRCYADNAAALKAIAYVLNCNDRFGEALSVAMQGLRIAPNHPLLHHNAAKALSITGNAAQARPHSEKAAMLVPDNPWFQYHFSSIQLCLGEFEEGWRRQRWFYRIPGQDRTTVYPPFAEWNGEPLAGATFLLVGEQGRGDEIQFLQLIDWLHQQGAIVDVLVSTPVASLAASMKSVRAVHTLVPPGPYTYWSHIFRVPEFMKLELSMLPVSTAYLCAPTARVEHWRQYIDEISPRGLSRRSKRIGLVWAGGEAYSLDRFRSIALDQLGALFAVPGVSWYSLQKGAAERDSEKFEAGFDVHTLGPAIDDFTDTLAILHSLDLVIAVDTAVAHLAGAGGFPVWVLVPAYSEWRWLTSRTDSPWYPSMRLFRQRQLGNWDSVIGEVRHALLEWLKSGGEPTNTPPLNRETPPQC